MAHISKAARVVFLLCLFLILDTITTVESHDDLSTIQWGYCSTQLLNPNDPYIDLVTDMLDDIATTVRNQRNYRFAMTLSDQGVTAYGFGDCDPSKTTDQCAECLNDLSQVFFDVCGHALGGQIQMTACYMRYENYQFL